MYAGVDGNPTRQGKPLNNVAPRGGFAWSVTEKTVIRGGYGLYWVPPISDTGESAIGARGYSASTTFLAEHRRRPDAGRHALESVPGRHHAAAGQLARPGHRRRQRHRLRRSGREARLRAAVLARLAARAAGRRWRSRSATWAAARSGSASAAPATRRSTSTSSIPQYLALGTALQQTVPNPFFGIAAFGNLSRSATIARGQLLRPFPQFDNVLMHRVNQARARYNAGVARWTKRMSNGYSLDVNYTFSRLEDNQFGESNTFSSRQGSALNNYDLDAEFGVSLLDVAHRLNVNATLPAAVRRGPQVADRRRRRRARRRLDGHGGGPVSDRVPAEHLAVEQQLEPARQQSAARTSSRASRR